MTVSATSLSNRFAAVSARSDKAIIKAPGFLRSFAAALEASGRKRAYLYFARKSDAELAQLGLTRTLLADRLRG